ncbi:spermatogenesis-defective protein 39 homolog [Cimex lectularius]|uniref:Vps16 C-terminal domain-containing protein n=1 Tax=Cimex lectularius TaxID=79782 RepID=A0A8I6RM32_CIMLE|nr:spermatogenesis-defective protein 39 homolog [Cimex lectularius]
MDKVGYWDESEVKGFDFTGEEYSMCGIKIRKTACLSQLIKDGLSELPSAFGPEMALPGPKEIGVNNLHEVFSEKSLDAIFDADNPSVHVSSISTDNENEELRYLRCQFLTRWDTPDVNRTLTDAFLGRPHSFELFKSFSQKQELLKAAEKLHDGDLILKVVIFLSKTLKPSLFHRILRGSPLASQHYIAFLFTKNNDEYENILAMLGRFNDAAIRQFTVLSNNFHKRGKLQNFTKTHFETSKDKTLVSNYIDLLRWQEGIADGKLLGESVSSTLSFLCADHWHEQKSSKLSPQTFVQTNGVYDKLYDWVAFNARAKKECWADISSHFIITSWSGEVRLKTDLSVDNLINQLCKLSAPQEVVQLYLQFLDSQEKKIEVAKKIKLHKVAIDGYVAMKDKQGLLNYVAYLNPNSVDYKYANKILMGSDIRWKS